MIAILGRSRPQAILGLLFLMWIGYSAAFSHWRGPFIRLESVLDNGSAWSQDPHAIQVVTQFMSSVSVVTHDTFCCAVYVKCCVSLCWVVQVGNYFQSVLCPSSPDLILDISSIKYHFNYWDASEDDGDDVGGVGIRLIVSQTLGGSLDDCCR